MRLSAKGSSRWSSFYVFSSTAWRSRSKARHRERRCVRSVDADALSVVCRGGRPTRRCSVGRTTPDGGCSATMVPRRAHRSIGTTVGSSRDELLRRVTFLVTRLCTHCEAPTNGTAETDVADQAGRKVRLYLRGKMLRSRVGGPTRHARTQTVTETRHAIDRTHRARRRPPRAHTNDTKTGGRSSRRLFAKPLAFHLLEMSLPLECATLL